MPRHPLTSHPVVLLAGRTGSIVVVSDAEAIVLFSNRARWGKVESTRVTCVSPLARLRPVTRLQQPVTTVFSLGPVASPYKRTEQFSVKVRLMKLTLAVEENTPAMLPSCWRGRLPGSYPCSGVGELHYCVAKSSWGKLSQLILAFVDCPVQRVRIQCVHAWCWNGVKLTLLIKQWTGRLLLFWYKHNDPLNLLSRINLSTWV